MRNATNGQNSNTSAKSTRSGNTSPTTLPSEGKGPSPRQPPRIELDRSLPVLLVRIGHYPLHHGTVGAIRSLGRLGVPVWAITEDRFTPAALSRHLRGRILWPTTGTEPPTALADRLGRIAARLHKLTGRRAVALCTDDEAAVLLAEHADALREHLLLPDVPPALPRALAGKHSLHRLCLRHGVATPRSLRPSTYEELMDTAPTLLFPLVAKNDSPYHRLSAPAVSATTYIPDLPALRELACGWGRLTPFPAVLLQEYLPREKAEDWIAHTYCPSAADEQSELVFTGVKVRSWPPTAGVTAHAYTAANDGLAEETRQFCRAIGFRGIADLDWRLDHRDGRYKLLDFNPRLGAQFRLFETEDGLDVVRAHHLDLSGRPLPPTALQVEGRRFTVELLDPPARLAAHRGSTSATHPAPHLHPTGPHELAWAAPDDPLPALAAFARALAPALRRLTGARSAP